MAFGAPTPPETVAKILEGRPDLNALPSSTPPAIRRLVRRCLERSSRTRLQHIGDALADIVDVRNGELSSAPARAISKPASRSRAMLWTAASIALVALGAAGAWVLSSRADPAAPAVPIRFDVQRVQGRASRCSHPSPRAVTGRDAPRLCDEVLVASSCDRSRGRSLARRWAQSVLLAGRPVAGVLLE